MHEFFNFISMHNFTLEIINMTTSVLPDFNIMCMKNHFYALKEYLYKSIISEFHINIRQTYITEFNISYQIVILMLWDNQNNVS